MKRSELKRTTSLKRKVALVQGVMREGASQARSEPLRRSKPLGRGKGRLRRTVQPRALEPGEAEWKQRHSGKCGVCRRPGQVFRHHVVYEQHVRKYGGDPWDMRDAMDVGVFCDCHADHHDAHERIKLVRLPDDAIAFAVQLLGPWRAAQYLRRYYAGDDPRIERLEQTHHQEVRG